MVSGLPMMKHPPTERAEVKVLLELRSLPWSISCNKQIQSCCTTPKVCLQPMLPGSVFIHHESELSIWFEIAVWWCDINWHTFLKTFIVIGGGFAIQLTTPLHQARDVHPSALLTRQSGTRTWRYPGAWKAYLIPTSNFGIIKHHQTLRIQDLQELQVWQHKILRCCNNLILSTWDILSQSFSIWVPAWQFLPRSRARVMVVYLAVSFMEKCCKQQWFDPLNQFTTSWSLFFGRNTGNTCLGGNLVLEMGLLLCTVKKLSMWLQKTVNVLRGSPFLLQLNVDVTLFRWEPGGETQDHLSDIWWWGSHINFGCIVDVYSRVVTWKAGRSSNPWCLSHKKTSITTIWTKGRHPLKIYRHTAEKGRASLPSPAEIRQADSTARSFRVEWSV